MSIKVRRLKTAQFAGVMDSARRKFTRRCGELAAGLLVGASPVARALAAGNVASGAAARLNAFLDEFATAEGPAGGSQQSSLDLSAAAFRRKLQATSARLQRLRAIDRSALRGDDLLNYRFAESLLVGQILEQQRRLWTMDPRVYLPFSALSQLIENPDATEDDAAKALGLLEALPGQLRDGQRNLRVNVARFRELARFMADGAREVSDAVRRT